jgi:hypothetical protein
MTAASDQAVPTFPGLLAQEFKRIGLSPLLALDEWVPRAFRENPRAKVDNE